MKKWVIVVLFAAIAACSSGVSGTYTDPGGIVSYTFKSGSKVDIKTAIGSTVEMSYSVDGNQIKIGPDGGPKQIVTIEEDGSLSGPGGVRLTKKS